MFRTLPTGLALAALSLFALSCGSSSTKFRLVYAVPDGQPIDVILDGRTVATGIAFPGVAPASGYLPAGAGNHTLEVRLTGQTTSAADYFNGTVKISASTTNTALATGFVSSNTVDVPAPFVGTNIVPTSGDGELRVIQASPTGLGSANGGVDIYLTSPGGGISGSPAISVTYPTASNYLNVPAGTYDILVTPAGIPAVDITFPGVSLASGKFYTLVLHDVTNGGAMSSSEMLLNDN